MDLVREPIADKPIAVDSILMVPERFRRGKSLLTAVTRNNFALVCLKMLPIQLGFIKLFPTDWKRLEGFVILKAGVVLPLKCLRLCIHSQQDFLTN